jgi:hypothetical protein
MIEIYEMGFQVPGTWAYTFKFKSKIAVIENNPLSPIHLRQSLRATLGQQ